MDARKARVVVAGRAKFNAKMKNVSTRTGSRLPSHGVAHAGGKGVVRWFTTPGLHFMISSVAPCPLGIAMEIGIEPTARHAGDLGTIPVVIEDACAPAMPMRRNAPVRRCTLLATPP